MASPVRNRPTSRGCGRPAGKGPTPAARSAGRVPIARDLEIVDQPGSVEPRRGEDDEGGGGEEVVLRGWLEVGLAAYGDVVGRKAAGREPGGGFGLEPGEVALAARDPFGDPEQRAVEFRRLGAAGRGEIAV